MKKNYLRPDAEPIYLDTDIITSSITDDFEHVNLDETRGLEII